MKKTVMMLALAAGVLLAASCGKTIEVPQQTGFTLTASIANPAPSTKTTYNDSGEGTLSVGWAAEEKLSLVIWDPSEGIIKNYILTSSGTAGDKDRDFSTTETVQALKSGQKYFCFYPAMTTEDDDYIMYEADDLPRLFYTKDHKTLSYLVQSGASSPAHLKDIDLLMGEPTVSGTSASVALKRQVGVLKLVINVPSEWRIQEKVLFQGFLMSSVMSKFFCDRLEADFSTGTFINSAEKVDSFKVLFSSPIPVPESDQFVFYVTCGANTLFEEGDQFMLAFKTEDGFFAHPVILASSDVLIEVGKMTTLTLNVAGGWTRIFSE